MGQTHSDRYKCSPDTLGATMNTANDVLEAHRDASECELNAPPPGPNQPKAAAAPATAPRRLSIISGRNIQLLSMRSRSERATFADDLRQRRRSSLINLILGAPSRGPRFSEDLCSLSSHLSESNFGIEFFPAPPSSVSSSLARLEPPNEPPTSTGGAQLARQVFSRQQLASTLASTLASIDLASSFEEHDKSGPVLASPAPAWSQQYRRPPLVRAKRAHLADAPNNNKGEPNNAGGRVNQADAINAALRRLANHHHQQQPHGASLRRVGSELSLYSNNLSPTSETPIPPGNLFEQRNFRRRSSSSSTSSSILAAAGNGANRKRPNSNHQLARETRLIIILQVCLPFILAGFGNMGAGLVLSKVADWRAFRMLPSFFVLLPPFIGFKGNIEMTLASRLSTLANLNLIQTGLQQRRAYVSNLILTLSQAIGLGLFAAAISVVCELAMGGLRLDHWPALDGQQSLQEAHNNTHHSKHLVSSSSLEPKSTPTADPMALQELTPSPSVAFHVAVAVILSSTLTTAVITVLISSFMMPCAIAMANLIQVNPDNLSTLVAALYGDVSCVLIYGLVADWMFAISETGNLAIPLAIISFTSLLWPCLLFFAHRLKETHSIAFASLPPMLTSIMISMGSGAILSLVIGRFKLIALYQPVVNGFGANLIAVQASRVSTWLWCRALRKMSTSPSDSMRPQELPKKIYGSLVSFTPPGESISNDVAKTGFLDAGVKCFRTVFWSFCNSSPNAVAARLLLLMLVPAQTLYFFVIWLLSDPGHIVLTWPFYLGYILLCVIQVTVLLTICEPFMTLLMNKGFDPDIFGISILMALADLIGTVCLATVFHLLAELGDVNATRLILKRK